MKFDQEVTRTLVTFLTGGGLLALITATVRGVRTVRTGALSSTRAVVRDLVTARNEAEDRLDQALAERDFWRGVAGNYSYQLTSRGITPNPPNPSPPRPTAATQKAAREERRRKRDELEDTGELLT